MATPDITVMGAGVFGLATAFVCQGMGARVQIIDPGGPGAGASGGLLGALAPHVPDNWNAKKAFQLASLLAAEAFWAEVSAVSGLQTGYACAGRLMPIDDAAALTLARARIEAARRNWNGGAEWRVIDAAGVGAWSPPSATGLLISDDLTARIDPAAAVRALAAAITARGGKILPAGAARGRVLWATGAAGLASLSRELGLPVGRGVLGQAALVGHALPPEAPQLFAAGIHFVPHAGGRLAIGSTDEPGAAEGPPDPAPLDALIARARAIMPAIDKAPVLVRWSGLRPRAATLAPVLGRLPGGGDRYLANGGFKIGIGLAPAVAEAMARLMLEDIDTIPPEFGIETLIARASRPPGRG